MDERRDLDDGPTFATPEAAALADWADTPSAHAKVIGVEAGPEAGTVFVRVQLDGTPGFHDVDLIICQRTSEGLWSAGSSTGVGSND